MPSSRSRDSAKPMRVLVGLGETAGYCASLVDGLREVGAAADHLNLGPDPMRYRAAPDRRTVRAVRWLAARRRSGPGPRWAWTGAHRVGMVWLFLDVIRRYDAVVLRAGDSFFGMRDLPILRRMGKVVVVVCFGSDSRPSYLNGAEIGPVPDGAALAASTESKRRMVRRIERSATQLVVHPMSAQLHRRRAVTFGVLGIPRRIGPAPGPPPEGSRPVRVLHAPSRPADKGTDLVREAVDEVRAAGTDVELRIVTGRPNAEVLAAIEACDVVIDQVFSDSPMAALAAEAAALGRPAIVGGYAWDALLASAEPAGLPPTHRCHPDALADAIRRLASDRAYRLDLGRQARDFVEHRWSTAAVGERYLRLLRGEAPASWWFDPAAVGYIHGAGAHETRIRDAVRSVLAARGPAGLALPERPDLVERLLGLVSEDPVAVSG